MRTSWMILAFFSLAACSSNDSSTPVSSAATCDTICDCECLTDATCLAQCKQQCPTYTKACQDCTLNVGCDALKGATGPAPQCASACAKTTCATICDCECLTNSNCLSQCNGSCPQYSFGCQQCTYDLGCAALQGLQGPAPQCSSQCP